LSSLADIFFISEIIRGIIVICYCVYTTIYQLLRGIVMEKRKIMSLGRSSFFISDIPSQILGSAKRVKAGRRRLRSYEP